jgi:hypothetical protein
MANTFVITGNNTTTFGTALNKNQTGDFFNSGSGSTIIGIGGNINVTGLNTTDPTLPGTDTNTTIELTTGTRVTPPIDGVKDTFTLDGSNNSLTNTSAITASTIKFTVLGTGGKNTVSLTDVTTSKITADIGVTGNAGGNTVFIDNVGVGGTATNTVAIGGSGNKVTLSPRRISFFR